MRIHLVLKPGDRPAEIAGKLEQLLAESGHETTSKAEGAEMILSVGGDGSLLSTIYRHLHLDPIFAGVNGGSLGYLCRIHPHNLRGGVRDLFSESPLTFGTLVASWEDTAGAAIQDLRVERMDQAALKLSIRSAGKVLAESHVGDGLIVTGALGSTSYNHSAGGAILPLDSKEHLLTPICPFVPQGSVFDSIPRSIRLSNLDLEITPHSNARLVLDHRGYEIKAGTPIRITQGKARFRLLAGRGR